MELPFGDVSYNNKGLIQSLRLKNSVINFHSLKQFAGPQIKVFINKKPHTITWKMILKRPNDFTGHFHNIKAGLQYRIEKGAFTVVITIKNESNRIFNPKKLSICLGLNTYMDRFPDWLDILFPTMLRCEPTHFWGYLMFPHGLILGIACNSPIASWSMEYNKKYSMEKVPVRKIFKIPDASPWSTSNFYR